MFKELTDKQRELLYIALSEVKCDDSDFEEMFDAINSQVGYPDLDKYEFDGEGITIDVTYDDDNELERMIAMDNAERARDMRAEQSRGIG